MSEDFETEDKDGEAMARREGAAARIGRINRLDQAKEALGALRELGQGNWIGKEPVCESGNRIPPDPLRGWAERAKWRAGQALAASGKALSLGLVGFAAATVVGSMIISPLASGLVGNASVATAAAYAMSQAAGEIATQAALIQRGLAFAQTGFSLAGALAGGWIGAKSVMNQPVEEFRQEMLEGFRKRKERKKTESAARELESIRIRARREEKEPAEKRGGPAPA